MKVSKNWLAQYVDLSTFQSAQDIADLLTGLGLEVEGVEAPRGRRRRSPKKWAEDTSGVPLEYLRH